MQMRLENGLGATLLTHQDRLDNGIFCLNLSNAGELDIANVIIAQVCLYIVIVLIIYSFYVS